ncbi:MAG: hypothetical protein KAU62_01460 [Candidatus Heimdallarchaeota archaeon]|nr:hypothetical protein [Candidatus Heimdallarchaeota archaeon]MCK4609802.1 hypothetical protein [Candidatus Heimdallarchaeota archaeon]
MKACESVFEESSNQITPNLKEKVYPAGVAKITYSPQTESVYYYKNNSINLPPSNKPWELFEDRGAVIESQLIEQLVDIDVIKQDFQTINKEEGQIEFMLNEELIESVEEFLLIHGSKAFRYRIDKGEKEKCSIIRFDRTTIKEEIVLFFTDKHIILNREDDEGNTHQRAMKYMNRTIVGWYYEGLLRIKRLKDKQRVYTNKVSKNQ